MRMFIVALRLGFQSVCPHIAIYSCNHFAIHSFIKPTAFSKYQILANVNVNSFYATPIDVRLSKAHRNAHICWFRRTIINARGHQYKKTVIKSFSVSRYEYPLKINNLHLMNSMEYSLFSISLTKIPIKMIQRLFWRNDIIMYNVSSNGWIVFVDYSGCFFGFSSSYLCF